MATLVERIAADSLRCDAWPGGRAPVQGDSVRGRPIHPPGSITWEEHVEVWKTYARKYGWSQTPRRIAERGGFGYLEIQELTGHAPKTWQKRST